MRLPDQPQRAGKRRRKADNRAREAARLLGGGGWRYLPKIGRKAALYQLHALRVL